MLRYVHLNVIIWIFDIINIIVLFWVIWKTYHLSVINSCIIRLCPCRCVCCAACIHVLYAQHFSFIEPRWRREYNVTQRHTSHQADIHMHIAVVNTRDTRGATVWVLPQSAVYILVYYTRLPISPFARLSNVVPTSIFISYTLPFRLLCSDEPKSAALRACVRTHHVQAPADDRRLQSNPLLFSFRHSVFRTYAAHCCQLTMKKGKGKII